MKRYCFRLDMKVRDYECDLQGVVNNANYQHYFEHARHEFLETMGMNFAELHERGIDAMVARVEIDYRQSLKSGDKFAVYLDVVQDGYKLIFNEDIYRLSDGKICTKAQVYTICVVDGKIARNVEELDLLVKGAAQLPSLQLPTKE